MQLFWDNTFLAQLFPQLCSWCWNRLWTTKRSQFTVMNDIETPFNELWMTKGHNQGIMNHKRSQFTVMINNMNDTVNDKKGHNILNNSFAHKPRRLTCYISIKSHISVLVLQYQCFIFIPTNIGFTFSALIFAGQGISQHKHFTHVLQIRENAVIYGQWMPI